MQPWESESTSDSTTNDKTDQPRTRTTRKVIKQLVTIICFSGVIYISMIKHQLQSRK
jgi:hypothetical protein